MQSSVPRGKRAIPTCPRNSHKGISAPKRSEKNPLAARGLIPMGILRISHVQDNIPIPLMCRNGRVSERSGTA
ncbi:hypothetical protein E0H76_18135 [Rhizobium leguminosarum bv. viciae]|nr:hypothetical protein E0H74_15065 [Rhizobium leguminosarum bv. viciae]TCA94650.1 hypothetical protein E0H76_18135 [Rhizobium leguminosarum bv. viciae]